MSATLQNQYPMVDDVGNEEMLDTFEQVLKLHSTTAGKLPLTLVVLDEMQQYINDDNAKALRRSALGGRLLRTFRQPGSRRRDRPGSMTANPTLRS